MVSNELGIVVTAGVALAAGFIRGATGFGGPAFMLATLTIFYTPLTILGKVLVVDLASSAYLFKMVFKRIEWRSTFALAIPTMITMPAGQWLLLHLDPLFMRRAIAMLILATCLLMLLGLRYKKPMSLLSMFLLGGLAGLVFGATYIALVVVAAILLGPYGKDRSRTLMISWAFFVSVWYGIISIISGATVVRDLYIALPGAFLYFVGVWLGSHWFTGAEEGRYRTVALTILLMLSFLSFLH